MFAIIEFMGNDDETAGEISIVPLDWLQKNETKCYWPINTKKKTFSDFVKDETPYKTSWPCYKIYKVHRKTASYSEAEDILEKLINTMSQSESNESLMSNRSLIRKVKHNLPIPARSSDSSDSVIEEVKKRRISRFNNKQMSSESSDEDANSTNNNFSESYVPGAVTGNIKHISKQINLDYTPSSSKSATPISGVSGMVSLSPGPGYETIVENLAAIKTILAQHSIILSQLQRHAQLTNAGALIPPPNLPDFPLKTYEDFEVFDSLLASDHGVETYMTNRLAAVGGTGVDSLTRRILRYVLTNEVAMLFNWKGREKKCFERTTFMKIVYASAKLNFPTNERNDLIIESAVKDWLKYSKSRLSRANKK